ncbi:MAG: helix-turn-helix transcriptional regulator [Cyanobacteria bacterium P01_E01_bin.6]
MAEIMKIRRKPTFYEINSLEDLIKAARARSSKSVTQLAADADMSVANWYRIEKGELQYLPEETLEAIESALGVHFGGDR